LPIKVRRKAADDIMVDNDGNHRIVWFEILGASSAPAELTPLSRFKEP
jgi:uncharacterized protein YuzE